jgi:hypothetical protein
MKQEWNLTSLEKLTSEKIVRIRKDIKEDIFFSISKWGDSSQIKCVVYYLRKYKKVVQIEENILSVY